MILPEPVAFLPGRLLSDPAWLSDRLADARTMWRTTDLGLLATLWWYSGSTVLLGPPVRAFMETGRAASVRTGDIRFTATGYGYLERVVTAPGALDVAEGPVAFGRHLDDALTPILTSLAEVGGVPIQRLWALAADALGNRLLAEWQRTRPPAPRPPAPSPAPLTDLARSVRGPVPSLVSLTALARSVAAGSTRLRPASYHSVPIGGRPPVLYLRRGSCCMIYRLPGNELCVSCPRQEPDVRRMRLEAHAQIWA